MNIIISPLRDLIDARLILCDDEDFEAMHRLARCSKAMAAVVRPRLARIRDQLHLCFDLNADLYALLASNIPRLSPLYNNNDNKKWSIRAFVLPDNRDLDYNNGDVDIEIDYRAVKACAKHLFFIDVRVEAMHNRQDNMTLQVQPYTPTTGVFKLDHNKHWLGYRGGLINHLRAARITQT